ncbi:MAG TPA: hypothetical protein VMJ90_00825 [Anaerolineales bacterium]|nr:hypothetical protein [Anaerolineales bacterium]
MKPLTFVFTLTMLVMSCAPVATLPPDTVATSPAGTDQNNSETPVMPSYAPQPGDKNLERSSLYIGESVLILRESFPVQVVLGLGGEFPTPCHQLRAIVNPPDIENKILVEAYTVVNPQLNCIQVLKPFQEMIELGTFPSGHYTVWVNGTLIGEFDS